MPDSQNYSNHTRWYPLVHFVIQPLLVINLLCQLVRFFMSPGWERGFWVLLSIVFILMTIAARLQALRVQDRLIRLEERLRYTALLTPDLNARAAALSNGDLIALRFASDAELPSLIERTLNGEFEKARDIKREIVNWRGDYLRV